MDFWEREGDMLTTNWVHIDMVNIFLQMGIDIFARYHQYRQENTVELQRTRKPTRVSKAKSLPPS